MVNSTFIIIYTYNKISLIKKTCLSTNGCSADNESCMKHEANTCCMVKAVKRVEQ